MRKIEDYRDWTSLDHVKVGGGVSLLLLAMLGVLLWGRHRARVHASWTETPCEIVSTEVSIPTASQRVAPRRYTVLTEYRYRVGEETYEARGFGSPEAMDPSLDTQAALEFSRAGLANGTSDHCLVDPADPGRSTFRYLEIESTDGTLRINLVSLAVFALMTAYGVQRGLRKGWNVDHH